jgi:hypothetical protein
MRVVTKKTLNAFDIGCLRKILGISWEDRITNKEIRERSLGQPLAAHVIQKRRLKRFGHVVRMSRERLPRITGCLMGHQGLVV